MLFADLGSTVRFRRVVYTLQASGYRSSRVCLHTSVGSVAGSGVGGVSAEDLAELYLKRWQIRVHYRALERTLGAAMLKGRTPDVVLKELWGYVMGIDAELLRGRLHALSAVQRGDHPSP